MGKISLQIKQFSYYPLVAVRNSFISIQWSVRNAFFVHINNGIGLKKPKGAKLATFNKSNTYRLVAFGWTGIKVKKLYPIALQVNNQVPTAQLTQSIIESIELKDINSIKLKSVEDLKKINQLNFKYKELSINPNYEALETELNQLEACESTEELNQLKDSYHV